MLTAVALGTFTVSPLAILAGNLGRTAFTAAADLEKAELAAATQPAAVLAGRSMVAKPAVSRPIGAAAANVIALPLDRPAATPAADVPAALQGLVRTVAA